LEQEFLSKNGYSRDMVTLLKYQSNKSPVPVPTPEEILKELSDLKNRSMELYSQLQRERANKKDAMKSLRVAQEANRRVEGRLAELMVAFESDVSDGNDSIRPIDRSSILRWMRANFKFSIKA